MRRLKFSAYLLSAVLAVGCSDKKDTVGDGDDQDEGPGGKVDGGGKLPDGGKPPKSQPDGKVDKPPFVPPDLKPTASVYEKDATDRGGLSSGDIDKLRAGGGSCDIKVLYPANKTVFPAGLTPPTIMWEGASEGAYVKMSYAQLDTLKYETTAGATEKGELTIDPADWNEIVRRSQGSKLQVTLNTLQSGNVSTCELEWTVAQGVMSGSIFYNTYNHPDKLGNGAVVRLQLGQPESEIYLSYQGPTAIAGPCISCHSVSANGSHMAASLHDYTPFIWQYKASSYEVQQDPEPMPKADLPESTFGAFTPDGTRMLSMGNPDCTNGSNAFPRSPNNFPLVPGPSVAELHDTATGDVIAAKGLNPGFFMWMPQFSPSGDKVVFNHAKVGPDGRADRRELATMDFDSDTNTFSNLKVVVSNQGPAPSINYAPLPTLSPGAPAGNNCTGNTPSDVGAIPGGTCTGPCYPAWPFFTPDGQGVIYSLISEPDFLVAMPGRDTASKSELWYVDTFSGDKVRLDTANTVGEGAGPEGNYYPTMLPVQVGGYYWLFWTSTRPWGHRDLSPTPIQLGANWFGGGSVFEATKKRIWVSAIRPRAIGEAGQEALSDTSSPGFYLEGQTSSGNVRAFATLNPCKQDGSECTSGLDCCTGYCKIKEGEAKGECVPEKTCSDLNDKCEEDTDCCPAGDGQQPRLCIGGYCGFINI
jgi:hypothetical protein